MRNFMSLGEFGLLVLNSSSSSVDRAYVLVFSALRLVPRVYEMSTLESIVWFTLMLLFTLSLPQVEG